MVKKATSKVFRKKSQPPHPKKKPWVALTGRKAMSTSEVVDVVMGGQDKEERTISERHMSFQHVVSLMKYIQDIDQNRAPLNLADVMKGQKTLQDKIHELIRAIEADIFKQKIWSKEDEDFIHNSMRSYLLDEDPETSGSIRSSDVMRILRTHAWCRYDLLTFLTHCAGYWITNWLG